MVTFQASKKNKIFIWWIHVAFKVDENLFNEIFSLMDQSNDEEDEEKVILVDIKQNFNI